MLQLLNMGIVLLKTESYSSVRMNNLYNFAPDFKMHSIIQYEYKD